MYTPGNKYEPTISHTYITNIYQGPHIINSKKRKLEEDLDDEGQKGKRRKEFETWDDLDNLMRPRVPYGNW